jgi:hypothetical protein
MESGGHSNSPAGRLHVAGSAVVCLCVALLWQPSAAAAEPRNVSRPVDQGSLPLRVHVLEDYETEIEKRWWLRGEVVDEVPATLSASVANRRSCRATETKDFDDKMGDASATYKAVIFNPVPGPPMAGNTRLSFRYRLRGTDTLRVQIYSLTNNYHRHLTLVGLEQDRWQQATVDMTQARRPDGSGGALSADERIDDIQFYIDRNADLWIDDIVLFDAGEGDGKTATLARNSSTEPARAKEGFPRRVIFTGWFDTGRQGEGHEWPGRFEIVPHERPRTWKAARSVADEKSGQARIDVSLRGSRRLSEHTRLRFAYRLKGAERLDVALVASQQGKIDQQTLRNVTADRWDEAVLDFQIKADSGGEKEPTADAIHFAAPSKEAELLVDDVLLYESANAKPAD